jgi:hypothetical protein
LRQIPSASNNDLQAAESLHASSFSARQVPTGPPTAMEGDSSSSAAIGSDCSGGAVHFSESHFPAAHLPAAQAETGTVVALNGQAPVLHFPLAHAEPGHACSEA